MWDLSVKNCVLIQKLFGAGSKTAYSLINKMFETGLLNENIKNIAENLDLSKQIGIKLLSADYCLIDEILNDCIKSDIKIITLFDRLYPERLKSIYDPPLVLYVKGKMPDFNTLPSITVVGPRKASEFGLKSAYSLGYRLSRAGFIVVSGCALGCDTRSHIGAIVGEGITVGVLGCGINSEYLKENKPLRNKIIEKGCLISEYPPKTNPNKYTFPVRNRIMSGLTLGTVVVEAGEKSGCLITARLATEQGRDVFIIPGNPTLKEYKGSNALLRDGAKPLLDTSDIFNEYILEFSEYIDIEKAFKNPEKSNQNEKIKKNSKNIKETLSNEAKMVYNYLDKQEFTFDDLSGLDISSDDILSALTELELENIIKPAPGGKYIII